MKYGLSLLERLTLVGILPKEGNVLTMRDVRDMQDNLLPTDKERTAWNIHQEAERLEWDAEAAQAVEIDFTTPQVALVVQALRDLESGKKLTLALLPLYELFVEDKK